MVVTDNPEYEHFKHVTTLQSWLKTQPHLPQNIRKPLLSIITSDLIKTVSMCNLTTKRI